MIVHVLHKWDDLWEDGIDKRDAFIQWKHRMGVIWKEWFVFLLSMYKNTEGTGS